MAAPKSRKIELTLHWLDYNEDVMQWVKEGSESWMSKYETVKIGSERLQAQIQSCTEKARLPAMHIMRDTLKAAELICYNQYMKGYSREQAAAGHASQMIADVFASKALDWPIAFCRLLWLMEGPTGERSTILRPPFDETEEALRAKAKPHTAAYSMSHVFQMLLSGSDISGGPNLKQLKSYEATTTKLFREIFMPRFSIVPILDGDDRVAKLKALRKDLLAAFDLAVKRGKGAIHKSATTILWKDENNNESEVLPAWAAIHYTRRLVEENSQIPKQFEVRRRMEEMHPSLMKQSESFWTKVWKAAGLDSLP